MRRNQIVAVVVAATFSFLPVGCNKSEKTSTVAPVPEKRSSTTDINSVLAVPSEGSGMTSPAKQNPGPISHSLNPSTVTSRYLASLQNALTKGGALNTANDLLTSKAREATRTANVDVSLPGSPNAKYLVHQAEFVTNERNVAHVLTSWNDSVEGEDYQYDVTWVLKNDADNGWGIAGMITAGENPGDTIVFNFEDAADIVSKGVPEENKTQTAQNNSGEPKIR
ncbi:MAG: hypothetical protein P8M80_09785 [Pirellulaceae bacterium]|nr:hypothetical protein [Pirellulaceae bacterium]